MTIAVGPQQARLVVGVDGDVGGAPSGDPAYLTGGDLSAGVVGPGGSFTLPFTAAGTYTYIGARHDDMGMLAHVRVVTDEDDD